MIPFLLRRVGASLLVLFGLSVIVFVMVRLVPGDTATAMLGMQYDEAAAAELRERYALDRPWPVQYAVWVGGLLKGDLGQSITGVSVASELGRAIPITLELAGLALLLAVLIGPAMGMLAAVRHGRASDGVVSAFSVLGLSVPGFWIGTLLILVFSLYLGLLPSGRYVPPSDGIGRNLLHMLMPAVALGLAVAAVLARMTRSSLLEARGLGHVRTAKAKGLDAKTVTLKHVARNALIPVITIAGLQTGYLLGGSVVIEEVFSLNGLGVLTLRALGDRDYPLLQAVVLLIGTVFLVVNLLVDVLVACVDPRLRLE